MNLISHTMFLIAGFVIENQYYLVFAQNSQHVSESVEDFVDSIEGNNNNGVIQRKLNHTFVALIDILFTDNTKRMCTGAIIHDNVIITAAHCFTKRNRFIRPELSASFVVIGSKQMFETRYEQYLPIERVITHPLYKRWTADLALVFTFANMMSDKPGTIIPLAGERMSTTNRANVTILSWGHCKEDDIISNEDPWKRRSKNKNGQIQPTTSSSMEEADKVLRVQHTQPPITPIRNPKRQSRFQVKHLEPSAEKRKKSKSKKNHEKRSSGAMQATVGINSGWASDEDTDELPRTANPKKQLRYQIKHNSKESVKKKSKSKKKHKNPSGVKPFTSGIDSAVVSDNDINEVKHNSDTSMGKPKKNKSKNIQKKHATRVEPVTASFFRAVATSEEGAIKPHYNALNSKSENVHSTVFNRWRRDVGPDAVSPSKKLTVETFGFVNVHGCDALVRKAKSEKYKMKNINEYVCYASEDHYITDEDSGAPAVRHGYLVAVTLGGVECDDEHVAVGIKVSCYCSWIAENLPDGGANLKCCDHCCDDAKPTPPKNPEENVEHRNKKRRNKT